MISNVIVISSSLNIHQNECLIFATVVRIKFSVLFYLKKGSRKDTEGSKEVSTLDVDCLSLLSQNMSMDYLVPPLQNYQHT